MNRTETTSSHTTHSIYASSFIKLSCKEVAKWVGKEEQKDEYDERKFNVKGKYQDAGLVSLCAEKEN